MPVNITDSDGKKKITIDDADQSKDTIVEDGVVKSYNEVADIKEKEAIEDEKKDDEHTDAE